jgi:hypothetical protein
MQYVEFLAGKYEIKLGHSEREEIRKAAYYAFCDCEARGGGSKIDGLGCVEWIRKHRAEFGSSLREAKDAWDVRVEKSAQTT